MTLNQQLQERFLSKYKDEKILTKKRSIALMYINITMIIFLLAIGTLFIAILNENIISAIALTSSMIIINIIGFFLLVKGKYKLSANIIVISGSIVIALGFLSKIATDPFTAYTTIIYFMFMMLTIAALLTSGKVLISIGTLFFITSITLFALTKGDIDPDFTRLMTIAFSESSFAIIISTIVLRTFQFIANSAIKVAENESAINLQNQNKLNDIFSSVKDTAIDLTNASDNMSETSSHLSDNSQAQAASVEEITATMEEISFGIDHISSNADTQNSIMDSLLQKMEQYSKIIQAVSDELSAMLKRTEGITESAQTGENNLNQMSNSIKKIADSSHEMNNIIQIINDISDQINLLSLNASIEAARAGDAGRGFAVVAEEISKLADKTSASVNDIGNLIKSNDDEINNGMGHVNSTVETLSRIISGVGTNFNSMKNIFSEMNNQLEANKIINEETIKAKETSELIKGATDEQKSATTEIVKSISEINESTQDNASSSEELNSNAQIVSGIANKLKQDILDI